MVLRHLIEVVDPLLDKKIDKTLRLLCKVLLSEAISDLAER
jgi:hypothetical protein